MNTLFEVCYIYTAFFVMFLLSAGIGYLLEKIGFFRWLHGWLWYFGFVDSEKEPEYTNELPASFFDRKKDGEK